MPLTGRFPIERRAFAPNSAVNCIFSNGSNGDWNEKVTLCCLSAFIQQEVLFPPYAHSPLRSASTDFRMSQSLDDVILR